jgi:hypothetical protein
MYKMRKVLILVHRLGQIFTEILDARLPMSIWLDSTTLRLYKTRP